MSFRKEKKYRLTNSEQKLLKSSLINKGMTRLYPKRQVNSCYFDTLDLVLFFDSDEGVLPRRKLRYRWYDDSKEAKKELKVTSIEGRYKIISTKKINLDISSVKKISHFDREYGFLYPVILISYDREYYIYKNLRITFDTNITYKDLRGSFGNKFLDPETVMEIKTSYQQADDFIESIINYPTVRFSKYSRGILMMEKML